METRETEGRGVDNRVDVFLPQLESAEQFGFFLCGFRAADVFLVLVLCFAPSSDSTPGCSTLL